MPHTMRSSSNDWSESEVVARNSHSEFRIPRLFAHAGRRLDTT